MARVGGRWRGQLKRSAAHQVGISMVEKYEVEKWILTEEDFEDMRWHDVNIYALAFLPDSLEFVLDIDYILQWINPKEGETYYGFQVAPATLVFENVHDLKIDLEPFAGVQIQDIQRNGPQKPKNAEYVGREIEWRWVIETHEGEISLYSLGYKQYLRCAPILGGQQALGLDVRGGISFNRGRSAQ